MATPSQAQVECPSGWTSKPVVISADRINDGYCDCPLTGEDEPNTSACSGSDSWTGVVSPQTDDTDKGYVEAQMTLQLSHFSWSC